jgi:hypothetical protein
MQHFKKTTMKKTFTILTIAGILTSCGVPQADYDKLKNENEQLKKEISEIEAEKSELKVLNEKLEEKKRIASNHSEAEALKLLKDYYDFYNSDMTYRNPRVRRVNGNTFKISLEDCTKKADFQNDDFFWHSQVLTLIINEDGTYKINW